MNEKEARAIGLKVRQTTVMRKGKWPWSKKTKKYLGYDLLKWTGGSWVKVPIEENGI